MTDKADGEAEKHRMMVNRVITMASRLGSSPRLLDTFLAIGERLLEIGEPSDDCWGELEITGSIKAGDLSHLKVGLVRSYQIKR